MRQMVLRWTVGVIAILVTVWIAHMIQPVQLEWKQAWHVIIFVPVLAIANAIIGPILKLIGLPINCCTFGLFSFVVNALLFYGAGYATGAQMNVWGALFGSAVYGTLSTVMSWPIKERRA